MKRTWLVIALLSVCLYGADGNKDVLRDFLIGNVNPQNLTVEKRAMLESMGINALADAFASKIGTANKIIRPIYPPFVTSPTRQESDYVRSCLSIIPVGKRDVSFNEEPKKLANRDFIFILDTSGSMLGSEFNMAKEAIASLMEAFCPSTFGHEVTKAGNKQMAMVLFGSRVTKVIDFEDSHKGLTFLKEKILSVRHLREDLTSSATALNYVKEAILGQGKSRLKDPNVSTDVIMITDGGCNMQCNNLPKEADAIRAAGANLFAFGVADARECELDIITGREPKSSFGLSGMKSFKDLADSIIRKASSSLQKCV